MTDAPSGPAAADRRRQMLDAAVRVFARQGFHACRVSDIANEAGVAYGLLYHYFDSKDELLDTLFLERWEVLLHAIDEIDRDLDDPRAKLDAIAGFIIESYRHDPDLMKVIIVEVTRAANSFGRKHLDRIREAFAALSRIIREAQEQGRLTKDVDPQFAALTFYGGIEQVLTAWIFDILPRNDQCYDDARKAVVDVVWSGLRDDV